MIKFNETVCLIVVDTQKDFCPGGALPVPNGDEIIPYVNSLIKEMRDAGGDVVYTKDWHPEDHSSFKENGGIWPKHCTQLSDGAAFHQDLIANGPVFYKGADSKTESYSGFGGRLDNGIISLDHYLKYRGIRTVVVVGLAGDYCCKATALDAKIYGYEVLFDLEGTKFVFPENREQVMKELINNFVMVLE